MNIRRCIFCKKTKSNFSNGNDWSIEHIIPLSLGNHTLITNDVCKNCNNKLGQNVDSHFVNCLPIAMKRLVLGLKGESGKLPQPFKEGVDQFGNTIHVDEHFNVTVVPSLRQEGDHFKGTAPSKEQAKRMIETRLKRNHYPSEVISDALEQIEATEIQSYQPTGSFRIAYEPARISLFILKIAYEYACLRLGALYFKDKRGEEIRNVLFDAINDKYKNKCPTIRGVGVAPEEISICLNIAENLNLHMIMLHPDRVNHLICEIFLFCDKSTAFSVIVSDNATQYMPLPPHDIDVIPASPQSFSNNPDNEA